MSNSEFKPLVTTFGSFEETEKKLFDSLSSRGFDKDLSMTIAHTFTKFVLGYVTRDGVFYTLVDNGASVEVASALLGAFEEAVDDSTHSVSRPDYVDKEHLLAH